MRYLFKHDCIFYFQNISLYIFTLSILSITQASQCCNGRVFSPCRSHINSRLAHHFFGNFDVGRCVSQCRVGARRGGRTYEETHALKV
jgi:hypothetical protein